MLRLLDKPWLWATSSDCAFFYVYAFRARKIFELETIASRGHVVAQPILSEGDRCYSGTKRWARIHITPGIAMGSAERVVTEVNAIVEAYQKRVGVPGTRQHGPCTSSRTSQSQFPDDSTSVSDVSKGRHLKN